MKIVIISDLHTGSATIAEDFCVGDSSSAVKKGYMSDLRQHAANEKLEADYLFIAGDITNRSKHEEFDLAAKRIKECAEIFNVSDDKVFFVPGNHDSNWLDEESSTKNNEPFLSIVANKYRHINNNSFFRSILERAVSGCYYTEPFFAHWTDESLNLIGINSSVFDTYDKKPHHGVVRKEDIKKLEEYLEENKFDDDKVNILMVHHHPIQHPDLPYEAADLSILQNSALLMELMTKYNFNFVIHGHKHIPRIEQHMDSYQHPVNVICAGSFSAHLDERWFQGVPNSIHLIEVQSKCEKNHLPQGVIKSWYHYSGHGWIKTEPVNSIPHTEYFGCYHSKKALEGMLEEIISKQLIEKGHISWQEICNIDQSFVFIPRKQLLHVITILSKKLKFKVFSSDSIEDLFVLMQVEGVNNG